MNSLDDLWKKVLNNIKGCVNTPTFKTWFEPIKPVSIKKNTITISVNSSFAKEWLESRHLNTITMSAQKAVSPQTKIKIIIEPDVLGDTDSLAEEESPTSRLPNKFKKDPVLFNPKYSFDTFVEGNGNRFAYTAAQVVSEKPGKAYNPLFIYGGVGLGKTHLLHAIGQYVLKLYPNLVVKYVSAEKFLNDFINALRYKNMITFKESYRNNDVLLVDDIQFLEEKEASQEEFFHTFNTLHGTNRQIVLSSDRAPKDLSTLEERLKSRFEWGLVTDIQPPNLETRIAILKKYSEREKLEISDQILNLIAEKITSNIREMEGAVIRIVAFASFTKTEPDLPLARGILKDMIPDDKEYKISNQKIIKEVSRYFSIPINTLIGSKRSQYIAHARQIGMYICRNLTSDSLPSIGKAFGNRDHTTVIYAITKINELISRDRDVYKQVQEITNRVKSSP
ncbi:MAG: chromosomal replication initiator protein DnaA [Actinobacteria bacterium]|nr:chromosomal replication initiator protein DnaA [Actinomycetota bacterium]